MDNVAPRELTLRTLLAVYTALCALRALQFSMAVLEHGISLAALGMIAAVACVIFLCGLPAFALVAWVDRRTLEQPLRARSVKLAAALAAGALVFAVAMTWAGRRSGQLDVSEIGAWAHVALFSMWMLTAGGGLTAILVLVREEARTAARVHETSLAAERRQREWNEIRLRFLRTQIEPHFLFNALANVKRLYETDPRGGRGLLLAIADYLELALSSERMGQRTVGDEVALTRAYLDIFAVRMGDRLRVRLDVPEDLRRAPMPPLMLGTLVENALTHGIGPRAEGGCIAIEIRRDGEDLVARVVDDGVGFREASGSGVGLSNTRARLATLFGDRGRLDLGRNPGGGVVATLRMPLESAACGA